MQKVVDVLSLQGRTCTRPLTLGAFSYRDDEDGKTACRIREDSPYLLLGDDEGTSGPGHAGQLETELGVVGYAPYSMMKRIPPGRLG